MADNEKTTYPNIPVKHWWALRNRFKQSIPSAVTPGYLAAALGMQEGSAKTNILPTLIIFKIVDDDGKPTDRAIQWRDDERYSQVCDEIKKEIYPQELLDALPGPSPDRDAVERWFANNAGVGAIAAKRMALVYLFLCESDPSKGQDVTTSTPKRRKTTKPKPTPKKVAEPKKSSELPAEDAPDTILQQPTQPAVMSPALHIDVQIHISPDASAEQIDQIFASMAKHLYKQID